MVLDPRTRLPPRRLTIDAVNGRYSVALVDGQVLEAAAPTGGPGWDSLARTDADLVSGELMLTLRTGEAVTLDLGWPGERDRPPGDSSIVYLDQCHWVTVAQFLHAPDRVRAQDREAAEALVELGRLRRIVLPLSGAHVTETAPTGKHRHDLAVTMLELSRGWQMRNPLQVRHLEIAAAIAGGEPRCAVPFTLAPDVIFSESSPPTAPADFPPAWAELWRRLTSMTANVAVMIEDDDVSGDAGPKAAGNWAETYQRVASAVHRDRLSPERTRDAAHLMTVTDLRLECAKAAAAAGVDPADVADWIENRSQADFDRAPHVRTLVDLLYHRLRNAGDRWAAHDLVDMHFLSCAAGYADLVVAEKKFGDYLQRARRRYPDNAEVVTSLSDAAEALEP